MFNSVSFWGMLEIQQLFLGVWSTFNQQELDIYITYLLLISSAPFCKMVSDATVWSHALLNCAMDPGLKLLLWVFVFNLYKALRYLHGTCSEELSWLFQAQIHLIWLEIHGRAYDAGRGWCFNMYLHNCSSVLFYYKLKRKPTSYALFILNDQTPSHWDMASFVVPWHFPSPPWISTVPHPTPSILNFPWRPYPQLSVKCWVKLFGLAVLKIWSSLWTLLSWGRKCLMLLQSCYSLTTLNYNILWKPCYPASIGAPVQAVWITQSQDTTSSPWIFLMYYNYYIK